MLKGPDQFDSYDEWDEYAKRMFVLLTGSIALIFWLLFAIFHVMFFFSFGLGMLSYLAYGKVVRDEDE